MLGEDITEELEYVPGRFVREQDCPPKLAWPVLAVRPIFTGPDAIAPDRARSSRGRACLAHVLVSKFADHLPFYRQSQIYARDGIDLDRSTLADWVGKSTALLEPLADAIGKHVRQGQAIVRR